MYYHEDRKIGVPKTEDPVPSVVIHNVLFKRFTEMKIHEKYKFSLG